MSKTDGIGTWLFNEILDIYVPEDSSRYFVLNFDCNNTSYDSITAFDDSGTLRLHYGNTMVYNGSWVDNVYRSIHVTFIDDTGPFIPILQANAVYQGGEEEPTKPTITDTTQIQLSQGGANVRLITPYNRESGNATLADLMQANVAKKADGTYQIEFMGYTRISDTGEITVEVQMDDLTEFGENVRGKITEVAFNAILQSGEIVGTLDETVADYKFLPNTNYRIDLHLPISTLTGALDNDYKIRLTDKDGNPLFINCIFQPTLGQTSTVGDLCQIQQYITTIGYTWTFTAMYREVEQSGSTVRYLYTENVVRESARAMTGTDLQSALTAKTLTSGTIVLCSEALGTTYLLGHLYRITTSIVSGNLTLTATDISLPSLANLANSTEIMFDHSGNTYQAHLTQDVSNKIERAFLKPLTNPTETELVGLDTSREQQRIKLGSGLSYDTDTKTLSASGGGGGGGTQLYLHKVEAKGTRISGSKNGIFGFISTQSTPFTQTTYGLLCEKPIINAINCNFDATSAQDLIYPPIISLGYTSKGFIAEPGNGFEIVYYYDANNDDHTLTIAYADLTTFVDTVTPL